MSTATTVAARETGTQLVATGAELVELSERFYRGLFVGMVVFAGCASVAALAMLPMRASAFAVGPPITIVATALIAAATPFAVWRAAALYRLLRRSRLLELTVVLVAASLVAYPLRSELWWPSCALIMVLAILVPLRRVLAYCLVVLLANLAAHVVAGDLGETPAVAILGLWIGFPFWSSTFSVIGDRFAAYVLRMQTSALPAAVEPLRVRAWVDDAAPQEPHAATDDPAAPPAASEPESARPNAMHRLTARQLQVTSLLVDGLRYREVAECLSISERQVQRHVSNAIERTGVRTANELVAVAVLEGLAPLGARSVAAPAR